MGKLRQVTVSAVLSVILLIFLSHFSDELMIEYFLGISIFFGAVLCQWPRPTGILASCLLCLILWGGVLNPASVEAGVTELRREVLDLRSVIDTLEIELDSLTDNQEKLVQNRRREEELIRNIFNYNDALQMKERVLGQSLMGSAFPNTSGKFLGWPLPVSGTLTSDYGLRVHPIYGDERVHTGIDLACEIRTPILAAADGVITYSGELGGYGLAVIVDHYKGMSTLYAHASELVGKVGQRVKRGDVVALVGSTGLSTGPHLHFEVREQDSHVDPWVWLE
ncbi:MAG: M23 family metallopeptidase [Firmicutes bacterium]|nr:M23 family metallopeptidase [Bacillota bacterium]